MQLLKWQTNSAELRALVDPTSSGAASSGVLSEMIAGEAATKALGVQWETNDDSFVFNPEAITKAAIKLLPTLTKRDVLKISARIFDPLGLISPVVLQMKMLFKKLWEGSIGWDSRAPKEVADPWKDAIMELEKVAALRIPR